MKEKILQVLSEYAGNIGHGEEVLTESQFDFIAEKLASQLEPPGYKEPADKLITEELEYLRDLWDEVDKLNSTSAQISIKNNIAMRIATLISYQKQ